MTAPGTPAEPRPSTPGTDPLATDTAPYGTGAPASAPPATTRSGSPSRARAAGRTAGLGLALALLLVVFNGQTVQISLVFTDVEAPLVLALLIAAALGALVASLAGLVLRARR